MEAELKPDKSAVPNWCYIIIQNPGTGQEQFLGYSDEKIESAFIPAFNTKEEAHQCFLIMPKDIMGEKYEVQAILKEDLMDQADQKGYKVFLMDDKSNVKEQLTK